MSTARVVAFHHVKLDIADLDRALGFYRGALGLRTIARYDRADGVTIVQLSPNGQPPGLELWHEPPHRCRRDDRCHFAFAVEDVDGLVASLESRGVEVFARPFTLGHERIAFIRDPDGYLIELNGQAEHPRPPG